MRELFVRVSERRTMLSTARADFQREVIQPFIDEYLAGRTPNPCVLCNRRVKFDLLFQRAKQLGAKYLATGHYVRLLEPDGRTFAEGKPVPRIAMGADDNKDQTYFPLGSSQGAVYHFTCSRSGR